MTGQAPRPWVDRWQDEIYRAAAERLPAHVMRHYTQGAREGVTARDAARSWSALRFAPHVLRDVTQVSTATTLLGIELSTPIGIAPTSRKTHADPDGDVAMARAAATSGTLLVVPSNTGEEFSRIGATGATWWLQLYLTQDRELVRPLLRRARGAGAQAVVLTADTPVVGTKYDADPRLSGAGERINHDPATRDRALPGAAHAQDLAEADIGWLQQAAGLPVVVKGVLRPDDALRCVRAGAAAVWVSNHGGRQLDRALSTLDALPGVLDAVGTDAEVYVDGGLHNGLDTLAALALGARAAFFGRLPLLSLAAGGEEFVARTMVTLQFELEEAMKLAGCRNVPATRGVLVSAHSGPVHSSQGSHKTGSDLRKPGM